jgi:hypothetical protein
MHGETVKNNDLKFNIIKYAEKAHALEGESYSCPRHEAIWRE